MQSVVVLPIDGEIDEEVDEKINHLKLRGIGWEVRKDGRRSEEVDQIVTMYHTIISGVAPGEETGVRIATLVREPVHTDRCNVGVGLSGELLHTQLNRVQKGCLSVELFPVRHRDRIGSLAYALGAQRHQPKYTYICESLQLIAADGHGFTGVIEEACSNLFEHQLGWRTLEQNRQDGAKVALQLTEQLFVLEDRQCPYGSLVRYVAY